MKKKLGFSILVILGIILLYSSIIITNENEYKLVREFGKVEDVISKPGISFIIPFIQTADTLPKEILLYDLPPSDVITMDKKTMISDCYVLWRITDPLKFAQSLNSSVASAENRIDTVVYNSLKNVISSNMQSNIISERDDRLSDAVMENIGNSMEQYGLTLLTVEIKRLDLPADNKTSVYQRMISERDKIAATYIAEGKSEAQVIKNTTDKEISISISTAKAEAERIIAEGEAEYMKILSNAYADESRSEFYSFVRALDAAKNSLKGDNKTLILPADSPISQIFLGK